MTTAIEIDTGVVIIEIAIIIDITMITSMTIDLRRRRIITTRKWSKANCIHQSIMNRKSPHLRYRNHPHCQNFRPHRFRNHRSRKHRPQSHRNRKHRQRKSRRGLI